MSDSLILKSLQDINNTLELVSYNQQSSTGLNLVIIAAVVVFMIFRWFQNTFMR